MTVYSYWQQSLTYPAATVRKLTDFLSPGNTDGVVNDRTDPLLVRSQATPNMTVRVNAGWAKKTGYLGFNDATTNVTIGTANASNPRIDLVVMRWRDTESGDASSSCTLEVIAGTPAASPSVPSTTGMTVQILAQVQVAAGTTSIASSAITDRRAMTGPYRFQARQSTVMSITSTYKRFTNWTPDFSPTPEFANSTGTWTSPFDGEIEVSGQVLVDGTGVTSVIGYIYKNGSQYIGAQSPGNSGAVTVTLPTQIIPVSVGDTIEVWGYTTSATNTIVSNRGSLLTIRRR